MIRRLETEQPCCWFIDCDHNTDQSLEHPVLGAVPCCQRCLDVIGGPDRPVVGWRFVVLYKAGEEERREPAFFMNPDRHIAAANVRSNFELWNETAEIVSIEWLESILEGGGWGTGKWIEGFKK